MKRAFFLIAVVTFVCMLSSCAELIIFLLTGVPYHFENHSSHVVNVDIHSSWADQLLRHARLCAS
jgi:hypothetical protein